MHCIGQSLPQRYQPQTHHRAGPALLRCHNPTRVRVPNRWPVLCHAVQPVNAHGFPNAQNNMRSAAADLTGQTKSGTTTNAFSRRATTRSRVPKLRVQSVEVTGTAGRQPRHVSSCTAHVVFPHCRHHLPHGGWAEVLEPQAQRDGPGGVDGMGARRQGERREGGQRDAAARALGHSGHRFRRSWRGDRNGFGNRGSREVRPANTFTHTITSHFV